MRRPQRGRVARHGVLPREAEHRCPQAVEDLPPLLCAAHELPPVGEHLGLTLRPLLEPGGVELDHDPLAVAVPSPRVPDLQPLLEHEAQQFTARPAEGHLQSLPSFALGFGPFAPGVLAHPTLNRSEALAALQELGAADDTIVMQGETVDPLASKPLRLQVRERWNLDALAENYQRFLVQFRPLWKALSEDNHLGEEACFIARTLLIHEYRKVQLRDPQLPEELLPTAWEGRNAHQLCRNLYRKLYQSAERWLDRHLETAEGPLPAPGPGFYRRFGGLE